MKELRVGLVPAADENTASSRIRVYTLARSLTRMGIDVRLEWSEDRHIVVFQKHLDNERMASARRARELGQTVVYDVDDLEESLWWWTPQELLEEMIALADSVVTATEEQRKIVVRRYAPRATAVVPCAADYYPTLPTRPVPNSGDSLRVIWFGNNSNFHLLDHYLSTLMGLDNVEPVIVIDERAARRLATRHARGEFVAWSNSTFVPVLQSCHLSCLMHDGSPADRAKSNTRMVTSIVWGVPALVSRTPEYERTALEAGVPDAIFDGAAGVPSAIERFRSDAVRLDYLDRAQGQIWSRYSPDAVASCYLRVLEAAHSRCQTV